MNRKFKRTTNRGLWNGSCNEISSTAIFGFWVKSVTETDVDIKPVDL